MASSARLNLPSLVRMASPDSPRPLQFLPHAHQQDSLIPCSIPYPQHSFSVLPTFASAPSPLAMNVFQDCSSPDSIASPPPQHQAGPLIRSAEDDSANSSSFSSSSDFCMSSNSDDEEDDSTGSSSASSSTLSKFASPAQQGPLDSLASLCAALPIKRGLSRYFSGKSQSFSALARVSSVAELAKPENPYAKRRRTVVGMRADSILKHQSYPPRCGSSAGISKRPATCNKFKSFKLVSPPDSISLEGLAKCFSVPEF